MAPKLGKQWRKISKQLMLSLVLTGILAGMYYTPVGRYLTQQLDFLTYDNLVKHHFTQSSPQPPIIIVDIDEYSMQTDGRWPWSRDKMALLVDKLKNAGVITIAFDVIFADSEVNPAKNLETSIQAESAYQNLPNQNKTSLQTSLTQLATLVDNDKKFSDALSQVDAVLGYFFHEGQSFSKGDIPSPLYNDNNQLIDAKNLKVQRFDGYFGVLPQFLTAAKHGGFATNIPDADGVIRRSVLIAKYGDKLYSSLALTTVMQYLLADNIHLETETMNGELLVRNFSVGGIKVPLDKHGNILIPFFGAAKTATFISASDILHDKVDLSSLAGAIVVVGSTATLLADIHSSPVSQVFPGVEMNANLISGILNQTITTLFPWGDYVYYIWLAVIFFAMSLSIMTGSLLIILSALILIGAVLIQYLLFTHKLIFIPMGTLEWFVFVLSTAHFIYDFMTEKKQKEQITGLFGQYVPPTHIQRILDAENSVTMEGETREMTVFFADIRSFTTLSEKLPATQIKKLLNEFFTPITKIIFDNQGTIDKYVGDMIMAFWGAPLDDAEHQHHALSTVLQIKSSMPRIVEYLESLSLPAVKIGMGLSTGPMDVGDMGSHYRLSYTVLGDTVNLASRLQDLTKFYGVDILVSEGTRAHQDDILWRKIDKVAVKGKEESVFIYEPVSLLSEASPEKLAEVSLYHQALASFHQRNWHESLAQFKQLMLMHPDNILYVMYRERISEFMTTEPSEHWDGTFVHTHK